MTEVAGLYVTSPWAELAWLLDGKLRVFLTDPQCPVSAVWHVDAGYDALVELILAARREHGAGGT